MMRPTAVIIACFILAGLCLVILLQMMGVSISHRVLLTQKQPATEQYDGVHYQVDVVRLNQILSHEYLVLIHRDESPDYGYAIKYPQDVISEDGKALLAGVRWDAQNVVLEFPDHATMTVPAAAFAGGR